MYLVHNEKKNCMSVTNLCLSFVSVIGVSGCLDQAYCPHVTEEKRRVVLCDFWAKKSDPYTPWYLILTIRK